jgi:hypothetical protein
VTTLAIILIVAGCAERLVIVYFTWKLARRKGRMWLPYVLFGLLGYIVLALRSPAYESLRHEPRATLRRGYTHTGFARPAEEIDEFVVRPKRVAPLAGYHLPRGIATARRAD